MIFSVISPIRENPQKHPSALVGCSGDKGLFSFFVFSFCLQGGHVLQQVAGLFFLF